MIKLTDFGTINEQRKWFIAWIGDLEISKNGNTPKIKVLLYPIPDSIDINNFKAQNSQLTLSESKTIFIDVGLIPLFSMGSILEKDVIIKQPEEFLNKTLVKLKAIDPSKLLIKPIRDFILKMGEKENEQKKIYTYPVYDFPLVRFRDTNMICLSKDILVDSKYDLIIIPCNEIVRFYFCNSDNITQELHTGGLKDPNRIFDPTRIRSKQEIEKNGYYILLRRNIPLDDFPIAGRIAYSEEAMAAAKLIYSSIQESSLNSGKSINVKSFFPFSSGSNLEVTGREIRAKGINNEYFGKKIFLVYNLITCTGKWPFNEIEYSKEESNEQGLNKDDPNLPIYKRELNHQRILNNGEIETGSNEPKNFNSQRILTKQFRDRFQNLPNGKKTEKIFQQSKRESNYPPSLIDPKNYSVGTETSNNETTGQLDIQIENKKPKLKDEEFNKTEIFGNLQIAKTTDEYEGYFRELVSLIKIKNNCEAHYLSDEGNEYMHFHPKSLKNNAKQFKWASGDYDSKKMVWIGKRKAIVCHIRINSSHSFLLFDWLKTPNEDKQSGGKILCLFHEHLGIFEPILETVKKILDNCSNNNRVWLLEGQYKEFERKTFKHYFEKNNQTNNYRVETSYNSLVEFLNKFNINLKNL